MKYRILFILFGLICIRAAGQSEDIPDMIMEDQLEMLSEESGDDEDSEHLYLNEIRKHKININTIDPGGLEELRLLSVQQINALIQYRKYLGPLVDIYELQAIPGWDIQLIKRVLPYIKIVDEQSFSGKLMERLRQGNQNLLARLGRTIESQKGYLSNDSISSSYRGSPQRMLLRYTFNSQNLISYGITIDKDAGEKLVDPGRKQLEFLSIHLFLREFWKNTTLAVGDFSCNIGQGLIHWQGSGFGKSSAVICVRRQGKALRPHRSSSEANFHRGLAVETGVKNWTAMAFLSTRKIDGNIDEEGNLSSLQTSGLHRTSSEIDDKKSVRLITVGAQSKYKFSQGQVGVNAIHYYFDRPLLRRDAPYNLFQLKGTNWTNYSVDYAYTYKNFHFFGELAIGKNSAVANLHGLTASLDPKIDVSLLIRNMPPGYQSLYSKAFTENTNPTNENGFYAGVAIKPANSFRLDCYLDIFSFPWLRFRVDAPSNGREFLVQATYTPSRRIELYSRIRFRVNQVNVILPPGRENGLHFTNFLSWRTNLSISLTKEFILRGRFETNWFSSEIPVGQGFLGYIEGIFTPMAKPVGGSLRLQLFETTDYSTRIYAFEQDLPASFSSPANFNTGLRYYLNLRAKIPSSMTNKMVPGIKIKCSLKFARSIHFGTDEFGSGNDLILDNHRSEIRVQLDCNW